MTCIVQGQCKSWDPQWLEGPGGGTPGGCYGWFNGWWYDSLLGN